MPGGESSEWRGWLVGELEGEILEIGFGRARNLPYYRRATSLHAIEPHASTAAAARRIVADTAAQGRLAFPVLVDTATAEALPYGDARFDCVVSSFVFCSVRDPRQVLREIRRVLRPGGALHMVEHVRPERRLRALAATFITPLWSRLAHNCHLDRDTVATLRAEGWQVTELRRRLVFRHLIATPARPWTA